MGSCQGMGRVVVLHCGTVRVMRGVNAVTGFGGVKPLGIQRWQGGTARQVTTKELHHDLFAETVGADQMRVLPASGVIEFRHSVVCLGQSGTRALMPLTSVND